MSLTATVTPAHIASRVQRPQTANVSRPSSRRKPPAITPHEFFTAVWEHVRQDSSQWTIAPARPDREARRGAQAITAANNRLAKTYVHALVFGGDVPADMPEAMVRSVRLRFALTSLFRPMAPEMP